MTEKQIIILYLLGHQTLLLFLLKPHWWLITSHPKLSKAFVGWSGLENDLISIYEYLTALIEHFEALESELEIVILWLVLWKTTSYFTGLSPTFQNLCWLIDTGFCPSVKCDQRLIPL